MSGYLRQSTASQARALGPFIDDTDFKSVETGLTIANTDVKLIKNGAASADKNSGGGTHRANGVYGFTFDATDTDTVGELEVSILVSGALVVFDKFTVLEEAVYDALFASSAPGYVANAPVNVAQFGGSNGTFASGRPEVNVSHFGGSAGTFSSGRPEVNSSHVSGSSTAADNLETAFASTLAEVSAAPAANAPIWTCIKWMFALARNKVTESSTTQTLRNDGDSGDIATATVNNTVSLFTRGKWS